MLRNADGGVRFSGKKRYEGVRFNVISITRGWVGVQFPEKKALIRNTSRMAPYFTFTNRIWFSVMSIYSSY